MKKEGSQFPIIQNKKKNVLLSVYLDKRHESEGRLYKAKRVVSVLKYKATLVVDAHLKRCLKHIFFKDGRKPFDGKPKKKILLAIWKKTFEETLTTSPWGCQLRFGRDQREFTKVFQSMQKLIQYL